MVLYERFLGRPFAGHRDSVPELVGDVLEAVVEAVLIGASYGRNSLPLFPPCCNRLTQPWPHPARRVRPRHAGGVTQIEQPTDLG